MARTIKAKEIVHDIRSGMTEQDLKTKYGLTDNAFKNLLAKLMQAGLLESPELPGKPPASPGVSGRSFTCPACGARSEVPFDECPKCGIIRSKASQAPHDMRNHGLKRAPAEQVVEKDFGSTGRASGQKRIRAGHIFVAIGVFFILAGVVALGKAVFTSPPPKFQDPPGISKSILPPDKSAEVARLESALEMHRETYRPQLAAQGIICLLLGGGLMLYGRKKLVSKD